MAVRSSRLIRHVAAVLCIATVLAACTSAEIGPAESVPPSAAVALPDDRPIFEYQIFNGFGQRGRHVLVWLDGSYESHELIGRPVAETGLGSFRPSHEGMIDRQVVAELVALAVATDFVAVAAEIAAEPCEGFDAVPGNYRFETGEGSHSLSNCPYIWPPAQELLVQAHAVLFAVEEANPDPDIRETTLLATALEAVRSGDRMLLGDLLTIDVSDRVVVEVSTTRDVIPSDGFEPGDVVTLDVPLDSLSALELADLEARSPGDPVLAVVTPAGHVTYLALFDGTGSPIDSGRSLGPLGLGRTAQMLTAMDVVTLRSGTCFQDSTLSGFPQASNAGSVELMATAASYHLLPLVELSRQARKEANRTMKRPLDFELLFTEDSTDQMYVVTDDHGVYLGALEADPPLGKEYESMEITPVKTRGIKIWSIDAVHHSCVKDTLAVLAATYGDPIGELRYRDLRRSAPFVVDPTAGTVTSIWEDTTDGG